MPPPIPLTPEAETALLTAIARGEAPGTIEAAFGVPHHTLIAHLLETPERRNRYAAAILSAADHFDAEARAKLAEAKAMTPAPGVASARPILQAEAQLLRCAARDMRKLGVQLTKRKLPDRHALTHHEGREVADAQRAARPRQSAIEKMRARIIAQHEANSQG